MLAYNLGPEVERLYMSYKTSPRIIMTSTKRENVSNHVTAQCYTYHGQKVKTLALSFFGLMIIRPGRRVK